MGHLAIWQRKGCFFPLSPFQCSTYVVKNFDIHVDLQHWFGGWGERESGLTELTKFCKLTLDCENFKNSEKYIRKCPNNFVQDCGCTSNYKAVVSLGFLQMKSL